MSDSNSFLESCLWALIDAREDAALSVLLRKMLSRTIVLLRNDAARPKALEVIKNVSNRVKTATGVKLPLKELLQVFNAQEASPFEKNFAMLFLEIGWKRGDPSELGPLVQTLLQDMCRHQATHRTALLQMALFSLEHVGARGAERSWEGFTLPAPEAELLRSFLLDVLLYSAPPPPKPPAPADPAVPAPAPAAPAVSAGLSRAASEALLSKLQVPLGVPAPTPQEYLLARKLPVAKALQGGLLPDEMAVPLGLVASLAAHHEVRRAGEEALKLCSQKVDWEEPGLVLVLYKLLLGDADKAGAGPVVPVEERRTPAEVPVRVGVLGLLCRSVRAANSFPHTLQAIFTCMYGADASVRLKQGAMQLTSWTLRHATDQVLAPMAGVVLSGLLRFIAAEAPEGGDAQQASLLKGFTYSAIGQLAQRAPNLFASDASIAERLFAALGEEAPDLKVSVQEALSLCCGAYVGASAEVKERLMALLQKASQEPAHQARFCGVYWVNRLFPFHDVRAREVCVGAVGDSKVEVREEAKRGLALPDPSSSLPPLLPSSPNPSPDWAAPGEEGARLPGFEAMIAHLSTPTAVDRRGGQSAAVKGATVDFCSACLSGACKAAGDLTRAAYLTPSTPEEQAAKTEAAQRYYALIRSALESALSAGGGKGVLDFGLAKTALAALLQLFSARRDVVAGELGQRLVWLENFLFCANPDTRDLVACVLGELAADMPLDQLQGLVERLAAAASPEQPLDRRIGGLVGLGFAGARGQLGGRGEGEAQLLRAILALLHASLRDRRVEVGCAACRSIALIGLSNPLPLPIGSPSPPPDDKDKPKEEAGKEEEGRKEEAEGELTGVALLERVGSLLKGREKESKGYEAAAQCLGAVAVSNRAPEMVSTAQRLLLATAETLRVQEFYLCVGEALACCAGGRRYTAPALLAQLNLPAGYTDATRDEERRMAAWAAAGAGESGGEERVLAEVLAHTANKVLESPRAQVRTAGGPWLLCLLRYNAEHPGVQGGLKEMQGLFTGLLAERSEFTQEVASKGLGLVYEMCKEEGMKDELVATLAATLMGTAQPHKRRAEDEKLFEEGQLKVDDKALGEGSLTTYKELCTVATELGQPDLIYRFLNLAGHQKVWTSRRGAAFGFSSIANQAAERLKPHLPALIPKLFRYQYDPNDKIQEAMAGLWEMVVPDPAKAKEEYLPHMLKELIPGVGSRLWRVREASCLALADLLPGKRLPQVEDHLQELHRMSLRAIDDVKESVRKAGGSLVRAVSGLTLRLADASQSGEATAAKTLHLILPLLIHDGICHSAEEVRLVAIGQLLKMTKHAGKALRPFIPDLALVLLESLSSLEPQMNTYLQLNADKYGVSEESLERARFSASRNSPLAETLERCLSLIDAPTADLLVARLPALIRSAVGLPTRAGVAKFVAQLASLPAAAAAVRGGSGKLLKGLRGAMSAERSPVIRHALAAAAAKVVGVGKEGAVEEYLAALRHDFLQKGGEDAAVRAVVGLAYKEAAASAPDALRHFLPIVVPVAFLGREDAEAAPRELFQQVWDDAAGSTQAGVRVYAGELAALIKEALLAPAWALRRMAAKAAWAWVGAMGRGRVSGELRGLLPPLKASLPGKTWDGKEEVVAALVALAVAIHAPHPHSPPHPHSAPSTPAEPAGEGMEVDGAGGEEEVEGVVGLVVAECARKRSSYRAGALAAATTLLNAVKGIDAGASLLRAVEDVFAAPDDHAPASSFPSQGKEADEEAAYESKLEEKSRDKLRALALAALVASYPSSKPPAPPSPAAQASRAALAVPLARLIRHALLHAANQERVAAIKGVSSLCALWTEEAAAAPATGPPLLPEEAAMTLDMVSGLCCCMKLGGAQLREMRRESFRATAALIAAAARRAGRAGGGLSGLFGAEAAGALTAALQGIPVQELDPQSKEALSALEKSVAELP